MGGSQFKVGFVTIAARLRSSSLRGSAFVGVGLACEIDEALDAPIVVALV